MILTVPFVSFIIILIVNATLGVHAYPFVIVHILLRSCEIGIEICLLNVISKRSSKEGGDSTSGATKEKDVSVTIELNSGSTKS